MKPINKKQLILTQEEKVLFIDKLIAIRKENPDKSMGHAIQEARLVLPPDRRFGETINAIHHLTWMKPLYEERLKFAEQKEKSAKRKHPVFLNKEEKIIFAEAIFEVLHSNKGLTHGQCLIEANKKMPPDRQLCTTIIGFKQIKWLPPLLEEIRAKKAKENEDKKIAEALAAKEAEEAAKPQPEEIHPVELSHALPPVVDLNKLVIDAIVAAVRTSVQQIVQSPQLQNAIQDAITPQSATPKVLEQHQDTRRKVLVVGLLPVQYNEVQKDFGRYFDLRFKDANCPVPQIKESMKNTDFAVLMTKFVSHSTANAMRAHPGFFFCNGNSTALKMLLKEKLQ